MKSIIHLCIITCDYWILCLRTSGSELGQALDFELGFKLTWCWEHLLDLNLYIPLKRCLDFHFAIPLAHGKDIWLEFHLDPHLNIQILDPSLVICLYL